MYSSLCSSLFLAIVGENITFMPVIMAAVAQLVRALACDAGCRPGVLRDQPAQYLFIS